jgi:hypothetical protein
MAATGATAFALTRTPTRALAPWGRAGGYADPRLNALSFAVLAPNPHNQQPWLVELQGEDTVALYFNPAQDLPETDPFDRQLCIGLGCFLELMTMAANAAGQRVDLDLFPEGEDAQELGSRPVAKARFSPDGDAVPDPLFEHVMDRRSNKEPFDLGRPISAETLAVIVNAGTGAHRMGGTVAQADIMALRQLTFDALMIELETPATYLESVDVFRIGKGEVNATPDGIDFTGAQFDLLRAAGLFTREVASDMTSMAYQEGRDAVAGNALSAMGFVWLVSASNTRRDQITTGRDWLRANLAATALGVGFHPMSQPLQEYPEMAPLYAQIHDRLAPSGGTVQMLIRIGYGPTVHPSPRWPIDAKVI